MKTERKARREKLPCLSNYGKIKWACNLTTPWSTCVYLVLWQIKRSSQTLRWDIVTPCNLMKAKNVLEPNFNSFFLLQLLAWFSLWDGNVLENFTSCDWFKEILPGVNLTLRDKQSSADYTLIWSHLLSSWDHREPETKQEERRESELWGMLFNCAHTATWSLLFARKTDSCTA